MVVTSTFNKGLPCKLHSHIFHCLLNISAVQISDQFHHVPSLATPSHPKEQSLLVLFISVDGIVYQFLPRYKIRKPSLTPLTFVNQSFIKPFWSASLICIESLLIAIAPMTSALFLAFITSPLLYRFSQLVFSPLLFLSLK